MLLSIQIVSTLFAFIIALGSFIFLLTFINNKYIRLFFKIWIDILFLNVILSIAHLTIPLQSSSLLYTVFIIVYFVLFYKYSKKSIGDFIYLYVNYRKRKNENKIVNIDESSKSKNEKVKEISENKKKINKRFIKNILVFIAFVFLNMVLFNGYHLNDGSFNETNNGYLINSNGEIIMDNQGDGIYYMGFFDREGGDGIVDEISYDLNGDNKIDLRYSTINGEKTEEIIDYSLQKIWIVIIFIIFMFSLFHINKKQKITGGQVIASIILLSLFFNNIGFYNNKVYAKDSIDLVRENISKYRYDPEYYNEVQEILCNDPKTKDIPDCIYYKAPVIEKVVEKIEVEVEVKDNNVIEDNVIEDNVIEDNNIEDNVIEDNDLDGFIIENGIKILKINEDDSDFVREFKENFNKDIIDAQNDINDAQRNIDKINKKIELLDDSIEKDFGDNKEINNGKDVINTISADVKENKGESWDDIMFNKIKDGTGLFNSFYDEFGNQNLSNIKKIADNFKDSGKVSASIKNINKVSKNLRNTKKFAKGLGLLGRILSLGANFVDKKEKFGGDVEQAIVGTIASDILGGIVSANPIDLIVGLGSAALSFGGYKNNLGDFTAGSVINNLVDHAFTTTPGEAFDIIKEQYDNVKKAKGFLDTSGAVLTGAVTTVYTGGTMMAKIYLVGASKVLKGAGNMAVSGMKSIANGISGFFSW